MVRTQIYIPEITHQQLVHFAEVRRASMAEVVREFIQEGLAKTPTVDVTGKTALRNLLKLGLTGGPRDLSINIDHYLYGGPKKRTRRNKHTS